jgi:Spy/CpxP family protein refolding chaperone
MADNGEERLCVIEVRAASAVSLDFEEVSMKRVQIFALGGALVLGAACAQKPATAQTTTPAPQTSTSRPDGERMGRRGDRGQMMLAGITLTADQQTQIQAIRDRHRGEMQGLNPRENPDDRTKMMQHMEAQMKEIRAVLTSDQQVQFDKNVAEMRERMQNRGGPGGPPPGN